MTDFKPPENTVYKRSFFQAKWESSCRACEAPIYEGEFISFSKYEPGCIICKSCSDLEDNER